MSALVLPGGEYADYGEGSSPVIQVLPGTPRVAPPGSLALWELGSGPVFQAGLQWPVDDGAARHARSLLPDAPEPALLRVSVAVTGTPSVSLLVSTGHEVRTVVTVPSSGYAPYTAALRADLDATDADAVRHALTGGRRRAFVAFTAALSPSLVPDRAVLAEAAVDYDASSGQVRATADLADLIAQPTSH